MKSPNPIRDMNTYMLLYLYAYHATGRKIRNDVAR